MKLFISDKPIKNCPRKRSTRANGSLVIYSSCQELYGPLEEMAQATAERDETAPGLTELEKLEMQFRRDLEQADQVYVYWGHDQHGTTMQLLHDLKQAGKDIHILACHCDRPVKEEFAGRFKASGHLMYYRCQGHDAMARRIADEREPANAH
jgi:hypothetical protein